MTKRFLLQFDIRSHWHIGDGQEAGAYADATTLKDWNNLPFLPGKSVKGLLREAFTLARDNQWLEQNSIDLLFGQEGEQRGTKQGLLQVGTATLTPAEIAFINQTPALKSKLYHVITSTAIEHSTGVAKKAALRSIEVSIPVSLYSEVTLRDTTSEHETEIANNALTLLDKVCSLIFDLGAKRHRGFGDVIVSVIEHPEYAV